MNRHGRSGAGRIRLTPIVVGILAASVGVVSTPSGAAADPGGRAPFRPVPAGSKITHLPAGLKDRMMTVMVELSGDPVAEAEDAAEQPLSTMEKRQRRDLLGKEQAPVVTQARKLGGTVLGTYQDAYNGIKVRIKAGELEKLAASPDVVKIHEVQTVRPSNTNGVPMIGAPAVWNAPGNLRGEGIKIAVLDTGIDYTHALFGGPGTTAAYTAARAKETEPADPAQYGPGAPKIKGGVDLVGDTYNADPSADDYQPVPRPDANPLDCYGHGTHVAGSAAGLGVLSDGRTYTGPYDNATVSSNSWIIGPGVAPKADLYAVRIFGCTGTSNMIVDGIEWAVENDMDVINLSVGSSFGSPDSPNAVAANNAVKAGVIVVAGAGNDGPTPYVMATPGSATGAITVAASDPTSASPGARLTLGTGGSLDAVNANGASFAEGLRLPVKVLSNGVGGIALGCSTAEFDVPGVRGALVVVARGTCARVAKAIYGQQAGAAAVLMVNNADAYPPFEGPITTNPDTGEPALVTIPFLGVSSAGAAAVLAADGSTITLAKQEFANPDYKSTAWFSSAGARVGDSWLKPDVTAPGVSIFSAASGTGIGAESQSGTSMATPHTAGAAALVKQAHPDWYKARFFKAAIVNTADPGKVAGYATRLNGAGLVQTPGAVQTQVVALGDPETSTLNYGFAELDRDYRQRKVIRVKNLGRTAATFTAAVTDVAGSPHTTKLQKTQLTVQARGETELAVTLEVPAGTAGDSSAFRDVSGLVTLTPVGGSNNGVTLRVPYYLVPQAVSQISTKVDAKTTTATITNSKGAVADTADWFAWGLSDPRDVEDKTSVDLKAVGVQSLPAADPADSTIAFAVSSHNRWSNAAINEFNILIDVDGDGTDDYSVVGTDYGLLTMAEVDGQLATAVFNLRTGENSLKFFADAPFDSSTLVLPVLVSQLCQAGSPCLSAANPRLRYRVNITGSDTIEESATFNPFTPALGTGMAVSVAPGQTATTALKVDKAELARTPARGWMVVSQNNESRGEAQLIKLRTN